MKMILDLCLRWNGIAIVLFSGVNIDQVFYFYI